MIMVNIVNLWLCRINKTRAGLYLDEESGVADGVEVFVFECFFREDSLGMIES